MEDQKRAESSIGDGVERAGGEGSDCQGDKTNADESVSMSMYRVELYHGSVGSHAPLERPVIATVRRRSMRNGGRVVDCNCETMSTLNLHTDRSML